MNKRILAISDIHGCYDEFCMLLDKMKYNPAFDQLILLGDYVNRGKDSRKVIQKVISLVKEGAIALRGNHDEWFLRYLFSEENSFTAFTRPKVGGKETLSSYLKIDSLNSDDNSAYTNFIKTYYSEHVNLLSSLPYFFETDDYIFVHGGINPKQKKLKDNTPRDFLLSRWDFIQNPIETDKIVVFGHTTCKMIHGHDDIWFQTQKIGIDGGCCFGLQLNGLEITKEHHYKTYRIKHIGS